MKGRRETGKIRKNDERKMRKNDVNIKDQIQEEKNIYLRKLI